MINNKISEHYCSFEVCKLLKEKGFWVQTYAECWVKTLDDEIIYNGNEEQHDRAEQWIMHPTHSVAIEWIRVNFGIWICVDKNKESKFNVHISPKDKNYYVKGIVIDGAEFNKIEWYNSPQEATEAALLYTLQNFINKN